MDLTIAELVRRLNNLPADVTRQGAHAHVEETESAAVITIPIEVFRAGGEVRSLMLPEGGLHGPKGDA